MLTYLPWIIYQNSSGQNTQPLPDDVPVTYFLGALGHSGLTAYLPLFKIGFISENLTIYISAAAGAVGMVAG